MAGGGAGESTIRVNPIVLGKVRQVLIDAAGDRLFVGGEVARWIGTHDFGYLA